MTAEIQRANIKRAALAINEVIKAGHEVVVTHGNGPQVGLLALQGLPMMQQAPARLMFSRLKRKA